jgi:hypothetical protein
MSASRLRRRMSCSSPQEWPHPRPPRTASSKSGLRSCVSVKHHTTMTSSSTATQSVPARSQASGQHRVSRPVVGCVSLQRQTTIHTSHTVVSVCHFRSISTHSACWHCRETVSWTPDALPNVRRRKSEFATMADAFGQRLLWLSWKRRQPWLAQPRFRIAVHRVSGVKNK